MAEAIKKVPAETRWEIVTKGLTRACTVMANALKGALRTLLQNSAVALLVASVAGDLSSHTDLSAALPNLLLEAGYSRDFEMEADQFALEYMLAHDIPPANFANILERMEETAERKGDEHNYLATHPMTSQRIRMFREKR